MSLEMKLFGPEMLADPYSVYAQLRESGAVCRVDALNAWVVTSHDAISTGLRDPRLSSDRQNRVKQLLTLKGLGDLADERLKSLIHMDAPAHTRLRGLVNKAFTPQVVHRMESDVQSIVDELLDQVDPPGEMDVIQSLAYPLPVAVIARMLGVPEQHRELFKKWSDEISVFLSGDLLALSERALRQVVKARHELGDYLKAIVAQRLKDPGDDLLTALALAEEDGGRLSEDELYSTAVLLLIAGHETTTNLIGNGLLALLRNPTEQQRLWQDPELVPSAVEEMLRYDSPVQLTTRIAKSDLRIEGTTIHQGDWVYLILAAGNRDPARFPDPDRFDVSRKDNRHLAFGGGPHFCLGAPLARVEAKITFESLRRRFPELRLGSAVPEYRNNFNLRGLKSLPVLF